MTRTCRWCFALTFALLFTFAPAHAEDQMSAELSKLFEQDNQAPGADYSPQDVSTEAGLPCANCGQPPSLDPGAFNNNLNGIAALNLQLFETKSDDELEKYFACYPLGKYAQNFGQFRELMKVASRTYDVPKPVLACLLFRESNWDPDAVSPTGAVGAGQQVQANIDYIHAQVTHMIVTKDAQGNVISRTPSAQKKLWDSYFQQVADRADYGDLPSCDPNFATKADAKCLTSSVAAAAFYLRQIQDSIESRGQLDLKGPRKPLLGLLLMGVGYNVGVGTIQRAVMQASVLNARPAKWFDYVPNIVRTDLIVRFKQKVAKGELRPSMYPKFIQMLNARMAEITNHTRSLANCLQSGNFEPPYGTPQNPKCE